MYKLKFTGTYEELQATLLEHDVVGRWVAEPNGVYMLRHRSGANLHWASTTGTVWVNGPREAAARLQRLIAMLAFERARFDDEPSAIEGNERSSPPGLLTQL